MKEDDFLNRVRQVLQDHQEPYEEGAWERFVQHGLPAAPVRKIPWWRWAAAAAAVVIGTVLLINVFSSKKTGDDNPATPGIVKTTPSDSPITGGEVSLSPIETTPGGAVHAEVNDIPSGVNPKTVLGTYPDLPIAFVPKPRTEEAVTPAVPGNGQDVQSGQPQQQPQNSQKPFYENRIVDNNGADHKPQTPVMKPDNGAIGREMAQHKPDKSLKKWQSSVYVSPIFDEVGVNMGYGVSVAYAVNNKISIRSGVAHTKLSATQNYDGNNRPSAGTMAVASSSSRGLMSAAAYSSPATTTTVESAKGTVAGIDIPVELNYNFSKKLYGAAGVSTLIVLNDNRPEYTLAERKNERVALRNSSGEIIEDATQMVNVTYTTTNRLPGVQQTSKDAVLGFYNLSLGYKQKVSKKNSVSIEPFVKIPIKNNTENNLNYTGSGIRLKFDF
ncbi:MAG: hypothetical protein QM727_12310 [Niabella sp.]